MNKIINKALFYKEWINVRWVTLLTIIVLLYFKVYGVISLLNQNKINIKQVGTIWTDRWFNNGLYYGGSYYFVMVCIVIILAIILFIGEKTSETQGFIASMPFTRKEIILNKWIVGVISLIISFIVTYIVLSLFYLANINTLNTTLNPYSDIVKWFFMDIFQYVFIFTFMMMAQAVMGNSIVAAIVGGIIIYVPSFILMVVQDLVVRHYGFVEHIYKTFDKIAGWINIYSYNVTHQEWFNQEANSGKDMYQTFYYTNYKSKLLIFFILTCIFLYLAYLAYKKRNLEYNLRLIVFGNLRCVFIWGFAICLGLLGGSIFGSEHLRVFGICTVIFIIIGYFISKLLLKVLSAGK
ncbi:ABC transporter permease [Clostridium algoriphilum]|uniref:ABC transporter permease subunit n=1 Tax=Clostridium algoriphilum TaxID=198347 RepID=UPI001CF33939|nr:ABC transporter permease subunit [Clostridium algoriphilum]MCB2293390.1 ABC transporter permease [Clostridium algoriphilum]